MNNADERRLLNLCDCLRRKYSRLRWLAGRGCLHLSGELAQVTVFAGGSGSGSAPPALDVEGPDWEDPLEGAGFLGGLNNSTKSSPKEVLFLSL